MKDTIKKYISNFKKWDTSSWVRSKPHQFEYQFEDDKYFFCPDLCPLFLSPTVREMPEKVQYNLLTQYFYAYVNFTVWLELGPVNESCDLLRRDDFFDWMSDQMKADALKIYVDEAGHAEMAHSLLRHVEEFTGVKNLKIRPQFLYDLNNFLTYNPHLDPNIIKIFFTFVSETLITGTLIKLPNAENVQDAVRYFAKDHAEDEGKHHSYFRQLFLMLWENLMENDRVEYGVLLPHMILSFLSLDFSLTYQILKIHVPNSYDIRSIYQEICAAYLTSSKFQEGARGTMSILKMANIWKYEKVKKEFESSIFSTLM